MKLKASKGTEGPVEWLTVAVLVVTYSIWLFSTDLIYAYSPLLGILICGVAITQFSSLQHEALHGHPFKWRWLNEVLVTPALTLTVPYGRFRDTHLSHHYDPNLTDPYDDPESNFFDPALWVRLPRPVQWLFWINNTLLGRIVLGPLIGNTLWLFAEARLIIAGNREVLRDWAFHLLGLVPVILWLWFAEMPYWAYLIAAWLGHGLLKIRTFLEHRAHETMRGRTVIVEDRGPLALLFLNNNYHAVHHMHPRLAWYRLPGFYAQNREYFLRYNDGYAYPNYREVFTRYFLRTKDPLPHPFYPPK